MTINMEWIWIPAVALVSVFILVLCWVFFKDYTCCPCRRRRPLTQLDDVESSRSVSFDGLPPTRPPLPAYPGYSRPSAPPPLPPVKRTPVVPQSRSSSTQILRVNELDIVQSNLISRYNFRGIADPSDVVKIQNGISALDLHGLKVWEAKKVTEMFLQQSRGRCRQVRIITGRGLHTPGGIPRIKPEIEKLLDARDYTFTEINKGGCLVIDL